MAFRGLSLTIAILGLLFAATNVAQAQTELFDTRAKQAIMIEAETGTILYSKDAAKLIPPASLAKLMTMEVVFHALKSGRYTMEDTFAVSENAWTKGGAKSGGSTMFAKVNSIIRLEDLIQGVIVQSANDACIVIAEGLAGSEENFATQMTERAREIGLTKSVFKNSTGLPAEGQVVTMREMALLGQHIWKEYPEYYKFYGQREFTWNKIKQQSRNPLLGMDIGADGMKTGFTEESGYAIVGSVNRDGHRVFVAMSGMTGNKERAEEARKLIEWGLTFEQTELFAGDQIVGVAQVFGGAKSGVGLKAKRPVRIFLRPNDTERLVARIFYIGPLDAPVAEGTQVGMLRIWIGDEMSLETPLYAAETVEFGTLPQRAVAAVGELMFGWLR